MIKMEERENGLYEPVYIADEVKYSKKEILQSKINAWGIALWCALSVSLMIQPACYLIAKTIHVFLAFFACINEIGNPNFDFNTNNPIYVFFHYTYDGFKP